MKNLRKERLGLLEKTILEFEQRGKSNLEEIKEYLMQRYQLTVSSSVLRRRMESLSF
tara:strand:- start:130645 stop:130815 length:171 start_codon:yes stop_codon:yes gene_type:complete